MAGRLTILMHGEFTLPEYNLGSLVPRNDSGRLRRRRPAFKIPELPAHANCANYHPYNQGRNRAISQSRSIDKSRRWRHPMQPIHDPSGAALRGGNDDE
jgi:hypothetical protein